MSLPVVAIVGRPNVGKSTLFNRLIGETKAIVHDVPGTTRDRIFGDVRWRETPFSLVDTGGLLYGVQDEMAHTILKQVETTIKEVDAVIFLVDVKDGLLPDDEEIAHLIRRAGVPMVLAANKVDNQSRSVAIPEFHRLGLGEPVPISAHHGIGVHQLMDAVTSLLPHPEEPPKVEGLKVAVVGRPNVGKSMLVNAILGEERAFVSPIPGTTRDAVDTPFMYGDAPMVLIDTAGLRRRGRIERGVEQYSVLRAMRAIQRADVVVLVTDAQEGVTAQDTHVAGYAKDAYKGVVIAVNKWDMAEELNLDKAKFTYDVQRTLRFLWYSPLLLISAKMRQGIDEVMDAVKHIGETSGVRVQTSVLNQALHEAILAHSPSTKGNKRLKFYYATQAEVNPPTFVFFVNDPTLLHFSYHRYLENRLREAFDFGGAPLRLTFRARGEQ
ncbi:MAG: small GTP-binding protein [Dehalococcoidia bacterium]|nr:small GTP-binding protein [Dehalococcoidia bacterium]